MGSRLLGVVLGRADEHAGSGCRRVREEERERQRGKRRPNHHPHRVRTPAFDSFTTRQVTRERRRRYRPGQHLDEFPVGDPDPAVPNRFGTDSVCRRPRRGSGGSGPPCHASSSPAAERSRGAGPRRHRPPRRSCPGSARRGRRPRWPPSRRAASRIRVARARDAQSLAWRHERLVPVLLEQLLEFTIGSLRDRRFSPRGPAHSAHRRPDARWDRRRGERHLAAVDARRDQCRLDAQVRDRWRHSSCRGSLRRRVVGPSSTQRPRPRPLADAAAHASRLHRVRRERDGGADRAEVEIAEPVLAVPAITFSTSSRFDSSSWSIRSSSVPVQISECTNTGLRWPRRCARSVACCSTAGFHQRSKWKTWFAAGRLRPRPPARIEMTRTDGPPPASRTRSAARRAAARSAGRGRSRPACRALREIRHEAGRSAGTA